MKNTIRILVSALLVIGIGSGVSFAKTASAGAKDDTIVKTVGTIIALDAKTDSITVKDSTDAEHTFTVTAEQIKNLKKDEVVTVKAKAGSNEAISVKPKLHKSEKKSKN